MRASDIRRTFLEFFRARAHTVLPSSPVVPLDDPTLLFTNAGMNQFKAVFTGQERRDTLRVATTQKCIRAGGKHNDLDNVGFTARHLTFFEMLGNFSFGDYFKRDACAWAWELVTRGFGLDPADLWVTVFHEDREARAIWRDEVGVPDARIVDMGEADNFWSMGDVGPCGPCSEIFFDRGPALACGPDCGIGRCDCDRTMEIWNLVFMQYEQHAGGKRTPLPRPSIDTGMGLERIAMVLQRKASVFETDALGTLIDEIARRTGRAYDPGPAGAPHRVIADHIRSLAFAIADGAYPSNEGRGYVLRRILRRAARFGYQLGSERAFIHELVGFLADHMGDAFPELRRQRAVVEKLIRAEEEQFGRTLKQGMSYFQKVVQEQTLNGARVIPGAAAFFLHDTCGFPIDLTEQMAREIEFTVERAEFDRLMDEQRERSRQVIGVTPISSTATVPDPGLVERGSRQVIGPAPINAPVTVHPRKPSTGSTTPAPATAFIGYQDLTADEARIVFTGGPANQLQVVLDRTPFYAEGGGQVGDTGVITGRDFQLQVLDTRRQDQVFVHRCELLGGDRAALEVGALVTAVVDADRRRAIQRNHTATHLVHAALRQVLGAHVQQKGSLVAPERLRFDISHYEKVSPAQLVEIERLVQEQILADTPVTTEQLPREEALGRGAMAFFGEKYGAVVRVVEIGDFSLELCGGAHCARTGEIGGFLVVGEGSVSSGVRRVEALTGLGVLERARGAEDLLRELCTQLKVDREALHERLGALLAENRELRTAGRQQAQRDLLAELDAGAGERASVVGVEVISAAWEAAEQDELLRVADALKRRPGQRVFILAGLDPGGVRFLVGVSTDLGKAVHAGNLAREGARVVGGGGGGRPDLAQAGGKDPAAWPQAVERMRALVAEQLAAR